MDRRFSKDQYFFMVWDFCFVVNFGNLEIGDFKLQL